MKAGSQESGLQAAAARAGSGEEAQAALSQASGTQVWSCAPLIAVRLCKAWRLMIAGGAHASCGTIHASWHLVGAPWKTATARPAHARDVSESLFRHHQRAAIACQGAGQPPKKTL